MLDVHAPEHPISSRRAFFTHLFTITCGLLIALMLENAAEAWHHHHQRREAEENIRVELEKNLDLILKGMPEVVTERDDLIQLLHYMEQRSRNQPAELNHLQLHFHQRSLDDAAWRTAASTGVLSFMPYSEVENFASAYHGQELLNTASEKAIQDYMDFGSYLQPAGSPDKLDSATAAAVLPAIHHAIADFNAMLALGEGTKQAYQDALKQ